MTLRDLIEASDLDGLLRHIDTVAAAADWDGLVEVRDRCLEAGERGKQLWGVAQFAEYRLALQAPGGYAGAVVETGGSRFTLGPLWEVAASTHTWAELAPHVHSPTARSLVAYERTIRGESLGDIGDMAAILEVPLELQSWEPSYPVAVYRADKADFPEGAHSELDWLELADDPPAREDDGATCDALLDVVRPWWDESSGRAQAVAVEGSASDAIRALGPRRVRVAEIDLAEALATMVWAGASGGAYGRRRGTPVGRSVAWWALLTLLDFDEPPTALGSLGREGATLRWYRWDPGDQAGGWAFHLAIEDPDEGLAWAVSAVDMR